LLFYYQIFDFVILQFQKIQKVIEILVIWQNLEWFYRYFSLCVHRNGRYFIDRYTFF